MLVAAVLSIGLVGWSLVANLLLGDAWYVTRNLVLTALLLLAARRLGFGWRELGLDPAQLGAGWRVGRWAVLVVVVAVGVGVAVAELVPPVGALLSDQRAALQGSELAFVGLVRIPLGTAVFEEVAFRGVLLAAFLQVTTTWRAVAWSSVVFGLWHVAPTIVTLRLNGVAPGSLPGLRAIAGGVAVTAVGGAVFAWLRVVSGSLLAPVLAHWATNSVGLVAAAWTQRPGGR
jgi:membrane protease YdiL (CAAX protease family)